jgi:integrase
VPHLTGPDQELINNNQSVSILKNRMLVRENKSEQTFKRYLDGVKTFTKFLKVNSPDEALDLFSKDADRTGKLDEFIDYMLAQGKNPIDIKAQWHGVKKWLVSNRINNIDWEYISRPKAISQIQDRIPTVDELKLILDNKVTLRDKAFFLVVAAAGFRLGTALSLQVKDYKPIEELGMITVKGAEGRKLATGKSYFTFVTPEARRILEEYLKTRGPLSPDSPLFAKESKGEGKKFDYCSNVSRQWTVLVRRAKLLEKAEGSRNFTLHGHSLRKFFQTHCKMAGCRANFVDFWMGHHPTGTNQYLDDSYFRPELKDHLIEYRKAVSQLQVFEQDTKKLGDLEKGMKELKEQNLLLKLTIQQIARKLNTTPEELDHEIEEEAERHQGET